MEYKRTRPGGNLLVWCLVAEVYAAVEGTLSVQPPEPVSPELPRSAERAGVTAPTCP